MLSTSLVFIVPLLVIVGLALAISVFLRRVVPTNMVHIVQTSKATTPYGRGKETGNTYYAWPSWVPKLGITMIELPESIFQVSLADYEAYDQARLPFIVDITAFFRISEAEMAAQRVASFGALRGDLQAVLQGAVRRILATNTLEEIMQSRSELGDQFTKEVQDQISEWGVSAVKTIEFMDLRDSSKGSVITNIMAKEQSRIDMDSRVKVAENNREALLAEIDADRTVAVQKEDAEQQVGLRTAQKEQHVGIALQESKQQILNASRTTAEREMDVRKITDVRTAEISRDVAVVRAEQDRSVAVVAAEAKKATQIVQAEGERQAQETRAAADKATVVIKADGDLHASLKDAEGIRARGEANAMAEQAMLMAPVETQIKLATEIGSNPGYQQYLVTIEQVRSGKEVGIEMARAMAKAEMKVIANSHDMQHGVAKLGDMFTASGGTKLTSMLAALGQTPEGQKLIEGLAPMLGNGAAVGALVGSATANSTAGSIVGAQGRAVTPVTPVTE